MRYRHRLRSRIIISFALFGLALTTLFAVAALELRGILEDQLIDASLQRGVSDFLEFKRAHPEPGALFPFSPITADIFAANRWANVPFVWQKYDTGVYNVAETGSDGKMHRYKLAVRKTSDLWAFYKYDVSKEELSKRHLIIALSGTVAVFSVLSLVIGFWSSARVMRPVTDLARRLRAFKKANVPEPLAPHFADDEVGELAAALDDYSDKLTALVVRDREFNADVSHELRTPLAVIASTTELLLAGNELTPKMHERLKRIERASRQCAELTNALLLLSRSERQGPSDGETTDVVKIAEQVIDVNRQHIGSKPIAVHVKVESPVEVHAPSAVVAVALGNLVGNAFKYTQAGDVVVRIGNDRVIVEDSGPGIKAKDTNKLFERGVRGEGATGKGAGLGLAIVRRLCELYGWRAQLIPRKSGGVEAVLDFKL